MTKFHSPAVINAEPGNALGNTLGLRSIMFDGEGRPPVTDGPFAETKDLIAGWYVIDVESFDRAVQLAGELSAAPGPGWTCRCAGCSR